MVDLKYQIMGGIFLSRDLYLVLYVALFKHALVFNKNNPYFLDGNTFCSVLLVLSNEFYIVLILYSAI